MGNTERDLQRRRSSKGFTLTELLIVVAVIGITSAVAAPSISGWVRNYHAKTIARQLMTDLQFARMTAVAQKLPCRVSLNTATNQYEVDAMDAAGNWNLVGTARRLADPNNSYYAQGVTLGTNPAGNAWTAQFDSLGIPTFNPGNVVTATINQTGAAAWTVQVSPTGGVVISGGPGFVL